MALDFRARSDFTGRQVLTKENLEEKLQKKCVVYGKFSEKHLLVE